ncbi:hypothetical protein K0M31_009051 [Melipona bicolor]|uniref:Uncharacterized protein n=1 Tax=Melipona bicolor TaxID=60889 RepID=A0AA40FNU1_9HYME|nr:hypothetical protein K0M31_009051 [Melipona bicolor]
MQTFESIQNELQATPLLLEVYATPSRESRDPNQPIANFRCISVAPEGPIFWVTPAKITFSDKNKDEKTEQLEKIWLENSSGILELG